MNRWLRLSLRIEATTRTLVPAGLAFLFALAGSIPLSAAPTMLLKPLLPLTAVYYWSLYSPNLLPAPMAFLLGLLVDILSGAPLGVCAAMFTLVHAVLCQQRRFLIDKSFELNWLGFALVTTGGFAMVWLLTSILNGGPVAMLGLLFQATTTVAVFPLAFWLLHRCHVAIVSPA